MDARSSPQGISKRPAADVHGAAHRRASPHDLDPAFDRTFRTSRAAISRTTLRHYRSDIGRSGIGPNSPRAAGTASTVMVAARHTPARRGMPGRPGAAARTACRRAGAFLLSATVTDRIPVLAVAAMAAVVLCCAGPLWLAGRLAFPRRRRHVTVGVTATVSMCCVVAATLTIFRPLDATRLSPGSVPMTATGVRYWDLPTGSHLAYTVIHAQGIRRPTPVIRLHGGPGTPGDAPDDLDRALAARGFDVYEYDQLGSGRSTRLSDLAGYTVDRQVADLEAIQTTIGAPQVILLGSSWGASLGAEYIGAHPDRVERVVFTSPGTLWAPEWAEQNEGEIWDRLTPRQQSRIDRLEANPRLIAWSLLMDVNPAAAHALVPDSEIDMVFAELLDIAGPAASCHPDRPIDAPSAVPGMYANQLISADQLDRPDPRPARPCAARTCQRWYCADRVTTSAGRSRGSTATRCRTPHCSPCRTPGTSSTRTSPSFTSPPSPDSSPESHCRCRPTPAEKSQRRPSHADSAAGRARTGGGRGRFAMCR